MCMRAHITPMKTLTKRDLTARFSMASSEIPVSSKIQVSLGIWIHLVFLFILLKSRPCFYLKRLCFCKNTFHLKGNIKKKKRKSSCQCRRCKRHRFSPWVRKIPWSRKWQPTAVFLPGKFHGQRSQACYSLWGCERVRND